MNGAASFEESMKRLEEIVNILESGNLSLEESISLYSEGVKLGESCKEALASAELTVKKLAPDNRTASE